MLPLGKYIKTGVHDPQDNLVLTPHGQFLCWAVDELSVPTFL